MGKFVGGVAHYGFVALSGLILWLLLSTSREDYYLPAVGAGALILVALALWLLRHFADVTDVSHRRLARIMLATMVIGQLAVAYHFELVIDYDGWDFNVVAKEASRIAGNGFATLPDYFAIFPNNIPIALFLGLAFRCADWLGIQDYGVVGMGLNILAIDAAIVLGYLLAKKVAGPGIGLLFLFFSMLFTPFYLFVPVYYTDTLPIFIPLAMIHCYLRHRESGSLGCWIALSLLAVVGVAFKATIGIVLIALLLHYALTGPLMKMLGASVLSVLIMWGAGQLSAELLVRSALLPEKHQQLNLPKSHWVMMGLKGVGGWDGDDYRYSFSFKTPSERGAAHEAEIRRRLDAYGPAGYLRFLEGKLRYTWTDGTYSATHVLIHESARDGEFRQLVLGGGRNGVYEWLSNSVHLALIGFVFMGAVLANRRQENDVGEILQYSLSGLFLFLLVWETMSRYLLHLAPLIVLLAALGAGSVATRAAFVRRTSG